MREGEGGIGLCAECLEAMRFYEKSNTYAAFCAHRQCGGVKKGGRPGWHLYQVVNAQVFWEGVEKAKAVGEKEFLKLMKGAEVVEH